MTKYSSAAQRRVVKRSTQVHPIWRGIGCLIIILLPIIAYGMAAITVQIAVAQNWPIPYQLLGNPVMPAALWNNPILVPVLAFIQGQENLYAVLVIAVLYLIVLGTFVSVGYAVVYQIIGPPRYTPIDAPPMKGKIKSYKR